MAFLLAVTIACGRCLAVLATDCAPPAWRRRLAWHQEDAELGAPPDQVREKWRWFDITTGVAFLRPNNRRQRAL